MGYAYSFNNQRTPERAPLPMSSPASIMEDKAEQMSVQFRQDERQALDSIHALASHPAPMPSEAQKVITERLRAIAGQRQEIAEAVQAKQLTATAADKLRTQLQLEATYLRTLAERYKPKAWR